MKKLSKKIFLLPLCALIANPFSAAFAVRNRGQKPKPKPRPNPAMAERKIEGCFKINKATDILKVIIKGYLKGDAIFVKRGLLLVAMDEACKVPAMEIFRGYPYVKGLFIAELAEDSDVLRRVNLSEGDRGCLNVIFAKWMADIFEDLNKCPEEEDSMRRFIEEFTRRLMSDAEVRRVCGKYPLGDELLNSLFYVAQKHLDTSPMVSMYSLIHCLKMLLA